MITILLTELKTKSSSKNETFLSNQTMRMTSMPDIGAELEILDDATKVTIVDYKPALQSRIIDFVHEVKKAVRYEEIKSR